MLFWLCALALCFNLFVTFVCSLVLQYTLARQQGQPLQAGWIGASLLSCLGSLVKYGIIGVILVLVAAHFGGLIAGIILLVFLGFLVMQFINAGTAVFATISMARGGIE